MQRFWPQWEAYLSFQTVNVDGLTPEDPRNCRNHILNAEEVAAAVSFLASEDASYITGNTLHVNGGMYMV